MVRQSLRRVFDAWQVPVARYDLCAGKSQRKPRWAVAKW
jgi:hypothetical protein